MTERALSGMRILDLTQLEAGTACTLKGFGLSTHEIASLQSRGVVA